MRSIAITDLGPMAQLRAGRLTRRVPQLVLGLLLYGGSLGLMLRSSLGLAPWDVLHYGLMLHLPLTLGQTVVALSVLVLLLWIPLREKPGVATLANAVVVGLSLDATLALVPPIAGTAQQVVFLGAGVVLNGLATALYIGSQLGRGPRDGLMTALSRVTGRSLRLVRTGLEVSVVALGLLLGGVAGVGTILYALAIGPLTQAMLPWVIVDLDAPQGPDHATRSRERNDTTR